MLLEDSSTYQWILNKGVAQGNEQCMQQGMQQGAAQEARRLLLLQGRKRFGASPASEATLQAITDTARLERMAERTFDATGWDDFLATA